MTFAFTQYLSDRVAFSMITIEYSFLFLWQLPQLLIHLGLIQSQILKRIKSSGCAFILLLKQPKALGQQIQASLALQG
jgi:hypothetical protein